MASPKAEARLEDAWEGDGEWAKEAAAAAAAAAAAVADSKKKKKKKRRRRRKEGIETTFADAMRPTEKGQVLVAMRERAAQRLELSAMAKAACTNRGHPDAGDREGQARAAGPEVGAGAPVGMSGVRDLRRTLPVDFVYNLDGHKVSPEPSTTCCVIKLL
jgi:hypothetical protein